ncbi:hypothetical protein AMTR_s00058p00157110 [Amborella trichopoda]|uniref:Uncharacterized protein n=1 Tax=Amborella trichopoda TaxID=13333 RepID=W1PG44_AMBTC|nr:hypothetical protein AMTR_s00058p00157110 [Amborella trichopoda]
MPRLSILVITLAILLLNSSGSMGGRGLVIDQENEQVEMRKLLLETTMEYDYGGANPKHEPKKGKPGGGKIP